MANSWTALADLPQSPVSPNSEVGRVRSIFAQLDASQWLAPADVEQAQLLEVRDLLAHCYREVPHYAAIWQSQGVRARDIRTLADFRRLPTLSRRAVQQAAGELRARTLPAGTVAQGVSTTSGTSGIAVEIAQTNVTRHWWWALYLRDLAWSGIDPRGALAVLRPMPGPANAQTRGRFSQGMSLPCWDEALAAIIPTGPLHVMDIHQDPHRQLDWLCALRPAYLLGYPSHLDYLARLLRDSGRSLPGLRVVQTVSETLSEEIRSHLESSFAAPVKSIYSCGEAGYLASPCPAGHGMHVHAEHVLLEVLDEADRPCAPGQSGRVVLTNLHNYLTPLVRYEIMDEATLATACPCGRGLPLLSQIQGKRRPLLHLPGGGVKHSDGLARDLRYLGGLHQYQIVQKGLDHVEVRVVPDRSWSSEHPRRIGRLVADFFAAPMRVDIAAMDRLPRPPGGKLLDVMVEAGAHTIRTGQPSVSEPIENPLSTQRPPKTEKRVLTPLTGRKVLLAWCGGGGHAARRLGRLARALAAYGARPVIAACGESERAALGAWSCEIVDAPSSPDSLPRFAPASYFDILTTQGFARLDRLSPMVDAWQKVLDAVVPDMVMCGNCPTLCLAAYRAVPLALLGDPFTLPPILEDEFPALHDAASPLVPQERLLRTVIEVQRRRGRPAPPSLLDLFRSAQRFLTFLPDLDPYRPWRRETHLGPLDPLPPIEPRADQPGYCAWLDSSNAHAADIVAGLSRSWYPGTVAMDGSTAESAARYARPGLHIIAPPADLSSFLVNAHVVVHHGDAAISQLALAAGRPQLVFPASFEQLLYACRLHEMGVAHYFTGDFPDDDVTAVLCRMLQDSTLACRAVDVGRTIHANGSRDPLPVLVDHCLRVARSR